MNFETSNFLCKNTQEFSLKYDIVEKKGKGSFGIVYLTINKLLKTERAMKKIKNSNETTTTLNNKTQQDDSNFKEALNEIKILKNLQHPNILKLYEYYMANNSMLIVTEFCKEGDLTAAKKIQSFQTAVVMYQLLLAVNYFHSKNVIHRDLKPENILITRKDDKGFYHVRVIDFGIACLTNERLTSISGSINYMAPEIFNNDYQNECDLWSCGVIMFRLLTGVAPFEDQNEQQTIDRIKAGKYDKKLLSNLDSKEKDLLSQLLEVNPKKRITAHKALEHSLFKHYNIEKLLFEVKTDEICKMMTNLLTFCSKVLLGEISIFYIISMTFITFNLQDDNQEVDKCYRVFNHLDSSKNNYLDLKSFVKIYNSLCI